MKKLIFFVSLQFLLFFILSFNTLVRGEESKESNVFQYNTFISLVDSLRETEQIFKYAQFNSLSNEQLEKVLQSLEKATTIAESSIFENAAFLKYRQGFALFLEGKMDETEKKIAFLKEVNAPGYVESFALVSKNLEEVKLIDIFGEKFPKNIIIPAIRRHVSCFYGVPNSIINWDRLPYFPLFSAQSQYAFPVSSFIKLGYYEKALCVFYEKRVCFYFRYGERAFEKFALDDVIVAEYAYKKGDASFAWNLLFEAGVVGDKEIYDKVKNIASQWCKREQNGSPLSTPVETEIIEKGRRAIDTEGTESSRSKCWNALINAYVKANANPRAWELLEEYRDEFEESPIMWKLVSMRKSNAPRTDEVFSSVGHVKERIREDWEFFIKGLIDAGERERYDKMEVYGQVLSRKTGIDQQKAPIFEHPVKPLDVKIPWNLDESSLEQIKEDICRKLEEIAASE